MTYREGLPTPSSTSSTQHWWQHSNQTAWGLNKYQFYGPKFLLQLHGAHTSNKPQQHMLVFFRPKYHGIHHNDSNKNSSSASNINKAKKTKTAAVELFLGSRCGDAFHGGGRQAPGGVSPRGCFCELEWGTFR